ncbi:hypothetical protein COS75_03115 [Candidatus Pacearchaeota archaeon CG06_land_8_20_14_3_00_35_12]|nr:MAG: hypothetical protein COS75_03115 [Candidatus Pacearchaeota archaeon CG06_land_8_20_14_3_00_35_12]
MQKYLNSVYLCVYTDKIYRMADLFESTTIVCNECNKKMSRVTLEKEGFRIRAWHCPECGKKIYHPSDIEEYKKFQALKKRPFQVKLRIVGNSYTVSIPKDIISFMQEEEKRMQKHMNEMVNLCFEESGRLSLLFGEQIRQIRQEMPEDEKISENNKKNKKSVKEL